MAVSQRTTLHWGQALLTPRLILAFALRQRTLATTHLSWSMTSSSAGRRSLLWSLAGRDSLAARRALLWSAPEQAPLSPPALSASLDGSELEFLSAELVADEESIALQCSMRLARLEDWLSATAGAELVLHLAEQDVHLLVDSRSRTRRFADEEYLVEASSPAGRLAAPFAEPRTRWWSQGTAQGVAQEICDEAGISIEWQVCDWPVSSLEFESALPFQMLKTLATEACVAISTLSGALRVQYRYPVSPTLHDTTTPELTLSDHDALLSLQQQSDFAPGYDAVELLAEAGGSGDGLRIDEWRGPDGERDYLLSPSQRMLAVFAWPRQEVSLVTSGCQVELFDQGEEVFEYEETLEIVDGRGKSSYPAESLLESEYRCDDLGGVSLSGYDASCEDGGNSMLRVRYQSRCRVYMVQSSLREAVQCWASGSDEGAEQNRDIVYRIQRGQGAHPAPELILDPLCRAPAIAKERGRNYLDAAGSSKERYEALTPLRSLALPGALVLVQDASLGERFTAKVTGWLLTATGGDPDSEPDASIRWDLERSRV